jgi:hypothetical protein
MIYNFGLVEKEIQKYTVRKALPCLLESSSTLFSTTPGGEQSFPFPPLILYISIYLLFFPCLFLVGAYLFVVSLLKQLSPILTTSSTLLLECLRLGFDPFEPTDQTISTRLDAVQWGHLTHQLADRN